MSAYTATPTVTSTTYPSAANVSATYASNGRWSIYNPSASITLFASVDGISDSVAIPPEQSWILQSTNRSGQLWMRLGTAGSVVPTCTLELGFDAQTQCSAGAAYQTGGDFTLPIATAGAFVPVAPAVGDAWALDDDSISVTLSSANTGALEIGGVTTYRYTIAGFATLSKTGTTVAVQLALFINGSQHLGAGNGSEGDVTTRSSTRVLPATFHALSPGDVVEMRIANIDNDDDFTCHAASLVVAPCGVG